MTTKVTVLNGVDTIGGNVVAFETQTARVIMDFGINFAPADSQPDDLLSNGILPALPDLFTDIASDKQTAIFISHLHLDHMGALKYLTKLTPVYMTTESATLYAELRRQDLESAPNAQVQVIAPNKDVQIGDLTVRAFATDHDIMGAVMFEVTDGQHRFVHSGDVRYDGWHPERVTAWTQYLHEHRPDLFFIEGTEFSFDDDTSRQRRTEATVLTDFTNAMASDELVVINPYERNVERLMKLSAAARQVNRKLVWDERFAGILRAMGASNEIMLGQDVTVADMQQQPGRYVLQNHFDNLHLLDAFDTFSYLHMNGEPLGDYDPRYADLTAYLAQRGVALQLAGASGHATPDDLLRIAVEVDAKMTVPWHSFHPEREAEALRQIGIETYLPKKGEIFTFE